LGYPFILKTRKLAYDGRGNYVVRSIDDENEAPRSLGCIKGEIGTLYAEKWVPFVKELAVMVVHGKNGEVCSYPPVETIHRNSICHLVFGPFRAPDLQVGTHLWALLGQYFLVSALPHNFIFLFLVTNPLIHMNAHRIDPAPSKRSRRESRDDFGDITEQARAN